MAATSEALRQLVHIGMGGLALLLPSLGWQRAAALAVAAVVMNVTVLPRVAPRLFRAHDAQAPLASGIVLYPLAVLGLILAFPGRLDIAAIAWVVLAAGDGFATLVGAHVRSPRLPWNRAKSVAGLVSFVVAGSLAGAAMARWWHGADGGDVQAWWIVVAPIAAAGVAGLAETAPIRLNDNISVPIAAAAMLWATSAIDGAAYAQALPDVLARLGPAAALNALVAGAGWRAGTVTIPGAIVGWAIGVAIYAGAGWAAWTMLLVAFLAAAASTRLGAARKTRLGIAEARGGRRGPGNAVANTGIAAAAAVLAPGLVPVDPALVALVAALVTGASDTVASEVGKAWGRTTWLVTSFERVSPGTSGAASLEGTIAGVGAAAGLGALAAALGLIAPATIVVVAMAATIASYLEGLLGATFEASGILNNDALNLINTAIGAGLALAVGGWMGR